MDKRLLQTYAVWAKDNLEQQVEVSLKTLGINGDNDFRQAKRNGDYTIIDGDPNSYPADLYGKRREIINQIRLKGYKNIIEEFAYTWFNRFVALRFMELHDFIPHGFRVLSSTGGSIEPDILKNLALVKDDLKLDMNICAQLKGQNKTEELFRYILICQCNALSDILPMLFSRDLGYMELLLPKSLLIGETVLTKLIDIPEENFMNDVEIIGWFYQFYVSNRRQEFREAKTVTKELLPTLTQVFTTDWIVRYMAENSLGRLWMESYPQSSLRNSMQYYVDSPEQTEEAQKKLEEQKYKNVNPEDIRIIEPCCGSGHILVYVMDMMYKMYEEKGYNKRDIPTLILKNNLVGLDVDKRAAQMASFSLVMKARTQNNRFFRQEYYTLPQVFELQDSLLLESQNYRKHMKELNVFSDKEITAVSELVKTFENAKTVGSLIKIPTMDYTIIEGVIEKLEQQVVPTTFNMEFVIDGVARLKALLIQARHLSAKYDVMITNPPYIGVSKLEAKPKEYLSANYPDSKSDMFAMFMEVSFVKACGFRAIVNPDSWMFLSSYESLREKIYSTQPIITMMHLGLGAFDAMVQTTAFVLRSIPATIRGKYFRFINSKEKESDFLNKTQALISISSSEEFRKIPGAPVAFWVGESFINTFVVGKRMDSIVTPKQGLATANNDLFLRLWYEVNSHSLAIGEHVASDLSKTYKWIPYNKGGEKRNWYGNYDYVVNWENNGYGIKHNFDDKGKLRSRPQNTDYYLREAITWNDITTGGFSIRFRCAGSIHDVTGMSAFCNETKTLKLILGLLSTKLADYYFKVLNPTIHLQIGNFCSFPVLRFDNYYSCVLEKVEECLAASKRDWDSFETSWDFQYHPLILLPCEKTEAERSQFAKSRMEKLSSLGWHYERWSEECQARFNVIKADEEELNRIFINIYGLEGELTPEVEDGAVTVRLADRERDVKSLISYLVGVVMGRYSLDVSGLAYAGGEWDNSKYITYQPDDDGIVPIYRGIGMEDGLTAQLIRLLKLIYGEDSYRQNMDFIAESIGRNNNESSEEALNRYLNDGFFVDHLKIYQKRPIYWLFSSGKNSGFKCLVYMHRYTSDTLARINSRYFLPESTRLKNDLEELTGRLARAEGRDRTRLERERQKLAASYNEAIEYGQVLDHMANQYIEIDLDDGVKDNYAKFQSVEMVTDSGNKVKKDLLAPIK